MTEVDTLASSNSPRLRSYGVASVVLPLEIVGTSQRKIAVAAPAPASCATMKPGASAGRIPAKVLLAALASVTAGFANEVDDVNQYAAVM